MRLVVFFVIFNAQIFSDSIAYQNAILADNPVGYWKLDESSGTIAADSSSSGYDGVYHGVTLGVNGPFCDGTTAASFSASNGSTVRISEAGSTNLDVSGQLI